MGVMTGNLFDKAVMFGDCHFGLRHNSVQHNTDNIDFINWLADQADEKGAETCFFLGDWHHSRSAINLHTQEYMLEAMNIMNTRFKQTYFLVGNHDLYYRQSRSVTSARSASLFPNIKLIDSLHVEGDVALIPWLVEDEWKEVVNIESKYLFGHLELPGFKMNAMVEMPDHGALNAKHFENQDYVFSGHFHKRQTKGKITYIGNPFGHNYADVWDFERGGVFLEWDKEPEFLDYENGPRFISIGLTALLEDPELYLKPKTYLQVILDTELSYEDASNIKENLTQCYDIREFKLVRQLEDEISEDMDHNIDFKSVDQIVIESLLGGNIESNTIDVKKLVQIYSDL